MSLHGYLYAASVIRSQVKPTRLSRGQVIDQMQVWAETPEVIVCAENPNAAQKLFEDVLTAPSDERNPLSTQIHKIVAAEFLDQLLTETGGDPLDWPKIVQQAWQDLQSTPEDAALNQGYWLNLGEVPGTSSSLEALRRDLPADTAAELNWSADRQYYFLIVVLSPPPPPPSPSPESLEEAYVPAGENIPHEEPVEENGDENADELIFGKVPTPLPLPDLEAAVLIRARNAAVAVWRWRQYAAGLKRASNPIRLEPWNGALGVEPPADAAQ
jgi:hypothetical protein